MREDSASKIFAMTGRLLPDSSIVVIRLDAGIVLICSGIANVLRGFAICGNIDSSSDYVQVLINAVCERFLFMR